MEKSFEKYKGIHPDAVIERAIIKGKRSLNTSLALKIERELGLEESTLVLLQAFYDIQKVKDRELSSDLSIFSKALFGDTDINKIGWEK